MLGVLRIMSALQFLEHGSQKLLGFPTPAHGMPPILSLGGAAGCIELFGSLFLLVGFQTRIAAFLMSGEMAIGYFMEHAPKSFFPALNGGDAAVLFCFVFLYFVFAGPGAWSLDGRRAKPA
jgi:putative oxidoreductase